VRFAPQSSNWRRSAVSRGALDSFPGNLVFGDAKMVPVLLDRETSEVPVKAFDKWVTRQIFARVLFKRAYSEDDFIRRSMSPRRRQAPSGAKSLRPISSTSTCGGGSISTCSARHKAPRAAVLSGATSCLSLMIASSPLRFGRGLKPPDASVRIAHGHSPLSPNGCPRMA
jgi:hypothetical protein